MSRLRKADILYIKRRVLLSILVVALSVSIWLPMFAVKMTNHHYREISDGQCNVSLLLPSNRPITALISDECSGGEWMRYLLEMATGVYTGSTEHNKDIFNNGFLGEMEDWNSGTTLLVHKRNQDMEEDNHFDAVVLVIRNPYSVLLCERTREVTGQFTDLASADDIMKRDSETEQDWNEFVTWHVTRWQDTMTSSLTVETSLLVVRYEDLEEDAEREILRIMQFLNTTVDEERLQCLWENVENRNINRFDAPEVMKMYSDELREIVDKNIQSVSAILESIGSDPVKIITH
ncbi:sialate:O-sulfotransferase 1-like isoform X2 [Ptychodera flava]